MNSGNEQWVKLDRPVRVSITYFTAWVSDTGQLNFRDDIYGHDKRVTPMMFANDQAIARTSTDTSTTQR
jgi:murein L,D-transpeptidase YcbB/YkuD